MLVTYWEIKILLEQRQVSKVAWRIHKLHFLKEPIPNHATIYAHLFFKSSVLVAFRYKNDIFVNIGVIRYFVPPIGSV